MSRGFRIGVWIVGVFVLLVAAVYVNETTVQAMAQEEVERGLNCAVNSGTGLLTDRDETKENVLAAINDYCMWGMDRYSIYFTGFDVDVRDEQTTQNQVDRTVELWAEYRTGELVRVERKSGVRGEVKFNTTTGQLTPTSSNVITLP